ncbi:LOW QUALITY PROTEIN: hypothetical protein TorRG33x02_326940 [Trema orientale]|uniref:Uncharacterized protein n=1 Tax=Trema orientale TaxID=63057 RepID=A0A2P5BBG6_TREOI|nr:LOW QUALITY PROTEIN: hypothetical protein TorRG33x02_326940 [Trema orientale]
MENMVVRTPTMTAMLGLKGENLGFWFGEGGDGEGPAVVSPLKPALLMLEAVLIEIALKICDGASAALLLVAEEEFMRREKVKGMRRRNKEAMAADSPDA